jgi:hypothetical protein
MNERIKQLAEQAYCDIKDEFGYWIGREFDKEKFAELIVRKCIKDCRDMFVVDSVSWNLLNEKLEHFGVEE